MQSENQFKVWSNQDVSQARADKDWWRKIWQNRKTLHSQSQSGLFDELEDDLCVRQSIGVGWIPHDLVCACYNLDVNLCFFLELLIVLLFLEFNIKLGISRP